MRTTVRSFLGFNKAFELNRKSDRKNQGLLYRKYYGSPNSGKTL
ncbi:hypothetical protein J2X69_004900 [Algoriphagus sp. 4150]|nr:hypothetical protein [Algoriphagus sp. 4150]